MFRCSSLVVSRFEHYPQPWRLAAWSVQVFCSILPLAAWPVQMFCSALAARSLGLFRYFVQPWPLAAWTVQVLLCRDALLRLLAACTPQKNAAFSQTVNYRFNNAAESYFGGCASLETRMSHSLCIICSNNPDAAIPWKLAVGLRNGFQAEATASNTTTQSLRQ